MTKKQRAAIYREAAAQALENNAWAFLKSKGVSPMEVCDWLDDECEERCLNLCFIAIWIDPSIGEQGPQEDKP